MAQTATPVLLKPETLESFSRYIHDAEEEMERTVRGDSFLWSDARLERTHPVREGQILAEFWSGQGPVKISNGLIHDWIGAALIADTTIERTLALVQDYDHHEQIYKPEVIASRLISHHGSQFRIHLRLLKKKVIEVVLDTEHDVEYRALERKRCLCRSYTTRIAEVEQAGSPCEKVLPPDTGHGFLWRLFSYWRFLERSEGVYVECRAISLTRDIPFGLGWIIEPIVRQLPRESLIHTLDATRRALQAKT